MPILKYKINGEWIELGGSTNNVQVDTTLSSEGKAADAKVTGEAIASKQNKAYFSSTKPSNWKNGDIWLKPAE